MNKECKKLKIQILKLRKSFIDSNNLKEEILIYKEEIEYIKSQLNKLEELFGFEEIIELLDVLKFTLNYAKEQIRKANDPLNFLFEDDFEDNCFNIKI